MRSRTKARLALVALLLAWPASARAGGDWNDDGIDWRSFPSALEEARTEGKPICLVVYTDWCPHCTNYSGVFHDEDIEEIAKSFVMVRLDQEDKRKITSRFAPDGEYVPRTMFIAPDGTLDPTLRIPRAKWVHFYDEHDPAQLLNAMRRAQRKLLPKSEDS